MSILRDAKTLVVKEIAEHLKESKALVVVNCQTLTVPQLQQIRQEFAESNVLFKMYKNRLVKIAAKSLKFDELNEYLIGQNIFVFAKGDDLVALKILSKFQKEYKAIKYVAGIYENKVVDAKALEEISKLPSYEESLMILGNSLLTPIRNLAIGLNMLLEDGKIKAE
ncbi:50S ribosomal protein L10 [Metamycoplasma hyosynoviae]|nr:50S ribosomal protein L10 [Metamycoplasma hyosynoviae]MDC8913723.1 50S ribosomal protein L10 [Metamycoplasma hyosynoviae]